ncbi:MAG: exodeoxyribonuclease VII large subunit [Chloroflexi bacterium]|nr:exodeoxyribonuclease VII large subunit [Chloroflexota bacterium]
MRVFGVGEVGGYLQQILGADEILADVWVTGEITSLTRASSGHLYFTLRDDEGQIRSVMWRSYAARIAAQPRAGDAVVAHGRVDFYPPGGSLQLVVDLLYPAGVGEAQLRFEALRLKLEEEGLFAEERKRPLPPFPRRIGLITSETGAVYHDVVTVLSRRYPIAQLVFAHSSVQGDRAPLEVVAALKRLAAWRDERGNGVDVVIVARGGGAPEELAIFNDERIARAVFAAPWPVISAVGHETDFTICDFVADHRAPTPSAAAEMASPDLVALRLDLAELALRGRACAEQALETAEVNVRRSRDRLLAHSPLTRIARDRQATLDQADRARLLLEGHLRTLAEQVAGRRLQLAALSPRATLDRGYSIVTTADGSVVRTAAAVSPGDALAIQLADGTLDATANGSRGGPPPRSDAAEQHLPPRQAAHISGSNKAGS